MERKNAIFGMAFISALMLVLAGTASALDYYPGSGRPTGSQYYPGAYYEPYPGYSGYGPVSGSGYYGYEEYYYHRVNSDAIYASGFRDDFRGSGYYPIGSSQNYGQGQPVYYQGRTFSYHHKYYPIYYSTGSKSYYSDGSYYGDRFISGDYYGDSYNRGYYGDSYQGYYDDSRYRGYYGDSYYLSGY